MADHSATADRERDALGDGRRLAAGWIAKLGVRAYELAMAHKASWLIAHYTMDSRVLGYLIAISIGTGFAIRTRASAAALASWTSTPV